MRKIVNKIIYDTENAKEVTSDRLHSRNSISWFEEFLYITSKGAWFLAGEGGPVSKYGIDLGQGHIEGGRSLTPMTADEVMTWLEKRGKYSILEHYFRDNLKDA